MLDVKSLTVYYATSIIGVGILTVPGIAYGVAGPASLISWIILSLLSFPLARSFARLIVERPQSSGLMVIIGETLGERTGRSLNVLLALTMVIGNPIMGIASARYLQHLLGFQDSLLLLFAFVFMLISLLVNLLGVKTNAKVQFYAFLVLVGILTAIMVFASSQASFQHLESFAPNGYAAIGTAITVCFFSFLGWENATNIAGDVKNPRATYPKAIKFSVIIVGLLYVLMSLVLILRVPPGTLKGVETVLPLLLEGKVNGSVGFLSDVIAIALIIISTNAWVFGASRVICSLGKTEVLPIVFARYSKRKVPVPAIMLLILLYGIILFGLAMFELNEVYLIKMANFNFLIIYLFIYAAALKLLKQRSERIFYILMIVLTIVLMTFFDQNFIISVILLLLSFFVIWVKGKRMEPKSLNR